jgi:hypothetical protein
MQRIALFFASLLACLAYLVFRLRLNIRLNMQASGEPASLVASQGKQGGDAMLLSPSAFCYAAKQAFGDKNKARLI